MANSRVVHKGTGKFLQTLCGIEKTWMRRVMSKQLSTTRGTSGVTCKRCLAKMARD